MCANRDLCNIMTLIYRYTGNKERLGNSSSMPGDNPVYDIGSTAATSEGSKQSKVVSPVRYTKAQSDRKRSESIQERELDNPIYGQDEQSDNVYSAPFEQPDASYVQDHEFDNPIYGNEMDDSHAYSVPCNSLTTHENENFIGNVR